MWLLFCRLSQVQQGPFSQRPGCVSLWLVPEGLQEPLPHELGELCACDCWEQVAWNPICRFISVSEVEIVLDLINVIVYGVLIKYFLYVIWSKTPKTELFILTVKQQFLPVIDCFLCYFPTGCQMGWAGREWFFPWEDMTAPD